MTIITLETIPSQTVVGITKTGPYTIIAQLIPELYEYLQSKGVSVTAAPIYVCHEMTQEAVHEANEKGNAVVEVCWPVDADVDVDGEFSQYELSSCTVAKALHKGPYETVGKTYEALFKLIAERNLVVSGFCREVYLNDPREVELEAIETEVMVPVSRA